MIYSENQYNKISTLNKEEYEHAYDHLMGLVNDIYDKGSIEDMEYHLEEVLGIFDIRIPEGKPLLEKIEKMEKKYKIQEKQEINRILDEWKEYNTVHLQQFKN